MTLLRCLIVPVALLSLQASRSDAVIVYNFGQDGNIGETDFTIIAGGQIILDIYATQEGQTEFLGQMFSDIRLSQSGNGFYDYQFRIEDPDMPDLGQSEVVPVNNYSFGEGYVDDGSTGVDDPDEFPNRLTASAFASVVDPPTAITPVMASNDQDLAFGMDVMGGNAVNSVLLGSITIQAAGDAMGEYNLEIIPRNPFFLLGDSVVEGPFIALPTLNGTLTVSAVPEPSTWAMCSLGFGFVALRRRKNRKAEAVEAVKA